MALAARILLSSDTLLPKWPVTSEAPYSGRMRRLVVDSDLILRAGAIWTGRSHDELQVGQLHRWIGTSLLPDSVTQNLEGLSGRIKLKGIPVCPECVRERPYAIKAVWRIPIAPVCTLHKVVLVDKCTRCEEPLRKSNFKGSRVLLKSFFASGCDHCGSPLADGTSADPDVVSATELVIRSLDSQGVGGNAGDRLDLDLAAVQDLVNLQLAGLRVSGSRKSVQRNSLVEVARVLPASVAAIASNGACCNPLVGVEPMRLLTYLAAESGVDRPAVRGLVARHYYLYGKANMPRRAMSREVRWPTLFPVEMSPLVSDHLVDAATDLGWDPSMKDLLRWTALLTAAAFGRHGGRPKHATKMTPRERKQLQQLRNAADERGIGERLEEHALTIAFAFFSTKRIKPAKLRRTRERLGAAG